MTPTPPRTSRRGNTLWRQFRRDWQIFIRQRMAIVGLVLIALFALMAVAHPILRATVWQSEMYNPVTGFDFQLLHPSPPGPYHLLGTDSLGHDVASMLLAATTPAFVIGLAAAITTALLSTSIGVLGAYYGGALDAFLMQVADAFLLLPAPLFMVIVGTRFADIPSLILGVLYGLIAGLGGAAIVMRSQALLVINKPFIEAARVAGGGAAYIMLRHVLPHMLPLAALYMMLSVTGAVVADGFIAFFGFNRSLINWGMMIYNSFVYSEAMATGIEWHVLLPPSLALSLFAAAFYFVSRGLHAVADPQLLQ